jgi:tRNA splicing ligase
MLKVQEYLRSGKTFVDLATELGIKTSFHEKLPLVIVNYDQIESPKTHPIVRECRALVLNVNDFEIVARSFPRFFNWGEVADEMGNFDFSDFVVHTKEDGSLVLMYHFDGEWHANTRGSFALDPMQFCDFTWRQAFAEALGLKAINEFTYHGRDITLVCEFCSPYNKVVRRYDKPKMFLLAAFQGEKEIHWDEVDKIGAELGIERPGRHHFTSIEQVQTFLQEQGAADPTFEGVVLCDKHGNRWKVKSATYLGLHRLKGEGDNLFNPKHLIPFIMAGETDELLTYFPEVSETYYKYKAQVEEAWLKLAEVWQATHHIEVQKDFALAIVGKTPFTGLLFTLRKQKGTEQTFEDLKKLWRDSSDTILKVVFDK